MDGAAQNRSGDDQGSHQLSALDLTFDERVLGFQANVQIQKLVVGTNFDYRNGLVFLAKDGLEIRHHETGPAYIFGADAALEEMLLKRRRFSGIKLFEQIAFDQIAIYGGLVVQVGPVL